MQKNLYLRIVKPLFDRLMSFLLTLILLPVGLLISITLIIFHHRVFFRQFRSGKNDHIFLFYKFYTIDPNSQESSSFQQFLRASSLDELPQLIHILQGKMSFVGPRPLLPEYNDRYSKKHKIRNTVLPGLTGLVQISGRNSLSWKERLDLDAEYIRKVSFLYDLMILYKTFFRFFGKSETQPSEKFTGYD